MGYERNTVRELAGELRALGRRVNSDSYRFLVVLREFDERAGYLEFGMQSSAHWLCWQCGFAEGTAREKVRVARALTGLPKIAEAMREGEISYCMGRSITRIATADNEEELLKVAEGRTVKQTEQVISRMRSGDELQEENARHASRYGQSFVNHEGMWILRAAHSTEQGAIVHSALLEARDEIREAKGDSCEAGDCHAADMADAIVLMAERYLAGGISTSGAKRHLIHVHVDEQVLREASVDGRCDIDGHAVAPATVKRLCCDGALIAIVENAAGKPVAISKQTRAIPTPLRRALESRDGGCRFPGCSNSRFVHAHHIEHWIDGGETSLENLVLLCGWHHRFLHEYGYRAVRDGDEVRFSDALGRYAGSLLASA